MRMLVVGAGATGGYFGGRLLQAGQDVSFLVRERRAALLAHNGLRIRSALGDADLPAPPTVTAATLREPFDLVLLSCKAWDLPQAIEDIAPAMGERSAVLPILNGMRQLDLLDARFGAARVLGGQCVIAATLDADGAVRHLNRSHSLSFGARDGGDPERVQRVAQAMAGANFEPHASTAIVQDMWDKWVFLASLAGITCLLRAPVGDIMAAPGGREAALALFDECRRVAAACGHEPHPAVLQRGSDVLTETGSALSASMMRDLEHGGRVEADHVIGDLLARGEAHGVDTPMLRLAYTHLKAYEVRSAHAA
ncbi:MAG: 2-dehydropantoate 2-reductase [Rhodanobacter sp. 68-29]|uniref:2-dehydropantoate 2-reductase n=1 Tax=Rhodanobacter sp. PCA2 TaxID=2006117 RepID=UPI00086E834F|nr:2-dehydropantoate 2-reductase [Rhodanobacter sp. PCA2]MBA2077944.1 2-dehydropantoate 2-reductase [Rhodanobacter sp. PCA2]MBN8922032.1 2-dehydropantoate 2-reductase [Rhodanobacter sp.]ODU74514.1 MAG: 2-dehydropantoate 2-reductase [Rhodanobacter sp. SCN 69-32]OJY61023.1 MAG: 2-dehydropantoate 2-reductase [Rhodanobacter sp. 68-29]